MSLSPHARIVLRGAMEIAGLYAQSAQGTPSRKTEALATWLNILSAAASNVYRVLVLTLVLKTVDVSNASSPVDLGLALPISEEL